MVGSGSTCQGDLEIRLPEVGAILEAWHKRYSGVDQRIEEL
jgi:hypothetical protein